MAADDNAPKVSTTTKVLRTLAYLAIGIAGGVVMTEANQAKSVTGVILVLIWGLFIITAVPAAFCAAMGRYRAEYMLLPFFWGGMALAAVSVWISAIMITPTAVPRALMVTALVLLLGLRYASLKELISLRKKEGGRWTRH